MPHEQNNNDSFYPRDAMRVLAMAMCLSVSQVGVLLKRLDGSSCLLVWELLSTSSILCYKKIQATTKIGALPCGTLS